ncbi:hypothetical protein ECC02_009212 [Trypanosoma cruzi]|uniref:Uncharacterized protein n=1 Tax=Trypanosoma cruzi TaxID=5693 RepID=A0A7J6XUD5_TRYCR|nr:hypothetical protein ECC02_009212 [Trypanosoma cruzi]
MGSSACCCSPQPSHRRVSAARRAQSLVCERGLREARRNDGSRVTPSGSERRKEKKSSEGREMLTRPTPKELPARKTNTQSNIIKKRQGVAVCVWRCGCLPALTAKKTKQEGKKCVLRPTGPRRTPTRHGSLSAPFVAAPPHACSRRGAQGRRHERVGGCASGAVGREKHGTPRRKSAEETINKSKRKNVQGGCPKATGKKKKKIYSLRSKIYS